MHVKPLGKLVILILVVGIAIGVWRFWSKLAPAAAVKNSVVPGKITLPDNPAAGGSAGDDGSGSASVVPVALNPGCADKPEVRLLGYAWNAQMGLLYANGGPQAAPGSLMCRHGVNLRFIRQDDNGKMQEALTAFATQLSQGVANPDKGAHFVAIMGDGSAAFLAGLNTTLARLGPGYQAKIVDAIGYSHGEDKLMGPAAWKTNPNAARGSFVAGVIRDGDWNIAQKWLGDNNIPTNPDEKTYDPNAMNWVNASDYVDAAQKYVAGYAEDRPVVVNGKRTGETKHVVVNGCVTWTPGDVTVAEKKGGLVSVISTREYSSQMPCAIIGIDKWMKANRPTVEAMIQAIAQGGQAVKTDPNALHKAAQISADVYHDAGSDAAYWERYYRGTQEKDATGVTVDLGGSSASNMADSLVSFGLVPGSADLVSATYTVFGNLVSSQYHELLPNVAPASDVIDKSYLQDGVPAEHAHADGHRAGQADVRQEDRQEPGRAQDVGHPLQPRQGIVHAGRQAPAGPTGERPAGGLGHRRRGPRLHGQPGQPRHQSAAVAGAGGGRGALHGDQSPHQLPVGPHPRLSGTARPTRSPPTRRRTGGRRTAAWRSSCGRWGNPRWQGTKKKPRQTDLWSPVRTAARPSKSATRGHDGGTAAFWTPSGPISIVSPAVMQIILWTEAALALLVWLRSPFKVLPRPDEVLARPRLAVDDAGAGAGTDDQRPAQPGGAGLEHADLAGPGLSDRPAGLPAARRRRVQRAGS